MFVRVCVLTRMVRLLLCGRGTTFCVSESSLFLQFGTSPHVTGGRGGEPLSSSPFLRFSHVHVCVNDSHAA